MSIEQIIRNVFPDAIELKNDQVLRIGNRDGRVVRVAIEDGENPEIVIEGFKRSLEHYNVGRIGFYRVPKANSKGRTIIQFSVVEAYEPKQINLTIH